MTTATHEQRTTSTVPRSPEVRGVRVDLAAVHRIVVLENFHEGTWNHFSAKVPGFPDHLLLSPGHTHFSRVTASSLLLTDPSGNVLEGTGTPNISAWAIHAPIQRARPDMACALHVHSPYATALATLDGWRFNERAGQHAGVFYKQVAYYDYEGIVTDAKEGKQMAKALGDKRVLFMANHGVLVMGETAEIAMLHLYALERACMTELLALSTGGTIRQVSKATAKAVQKMSHEGFGEAGYLDGMKEVLDNRGEDYAS